MKHLVNDLRYAVRMILKNPAFTTVAVLTLALGIGANTAMFSLIDGVLLKPLSMPKAEEIVAVSQTAPASGFPSYGISEGQFDALKSEVRTLGEVAAYHTLPTLLTGVEDPTRIRIAHVSAGTLQVLGFQPALGRDLLPEENLPQRNNVVLLSDGTWKRRFGADPAILGQTIRLDERPSTIIGVLPPEAQLPEDLASSDKIELWQAEAIDPANPARWGSHFLGCLARLKPGATVEQARAEVDILFRRLRQEHPESDNRDPSHAILVRALQHDLTANSRTALLVLLAAVGFVLLIACANVANLLLARGSGRERELAIRAAIGAGRGRLIAQLLSETLLLALLGGTLGCLLAWWGLDLLALLRPGNLPRLDEVALDARVLLFAVVLSTLTTVLFGLAPALQLSRVDLNRALRLEGAGTSAGLRRQSLQRALVAAEVALAVVLLLGAGLLGRSLYSLLQINPGFRTENLLTLRIALPASKYSDGKQSAAYFSELSGRLRGMPGVAAVANVNAIPLTGFGGDTVFDVEGRNPLRDTLGTTGIMAQHLGFRFASATYFETLGIPRLGGRTFDDHDHADSKRVVVINETMAKRFWPGQDPVGQRIRLYQNPTTTGPWMEIIGVTGDTRIRQLNEEAKPEIVMPFAQNPGRGTALLVRTTGKPEDLAARVREEARGLEKDAVITNIATMDELLNRTIAQPRMNLAVLGLLSALALVMAVIGVYGVMSYVVSQRTREMGIRLALGAQKEDVLRLVLRQGLGVTLLGVTVGVIAAAALTRLMRSLLFEVSPTDPITFGGVAVLLVGVALLACWIPARRAARVDPMVALRYE